MYINIFRVNPSLLRGCGARSLGLAPRLNHIAPPCVYRYSQGLRPNLGSYLDLAGELNHMAPPVFIGTLRPCDRTWTLTLYLYTHTHTHI